MKDDKKPSIIKDAITDYNAIREAADANAKKKLAEEFPESFNKLLKEELQNKKNKTTKESYKKIDEVKESEKSDVESNTESVMKKETKETTKVVNENAGEGKPFDEKAKGLQSVKEEREKDFMGDVESDTPNQAKGKEMEKGKAFDEKLKGPSSGKPLPNMTEEFDITELDINSVGSALENAGEDDEVITMDEIENEISNMQGLDNEMSNVEASAPVEDKGNPYDQLMGMRNQIDEILKGMNPATPAPEAAPITEEPEVTDADVDAVLGQANEVSEAEVDEAHGVSYGMRRNTVGTHTPSFDSLSAGEQDQSPAKLQEAQKKINALITENKSLTKKLNESKKYKQSVTTLVEQYKSALEKYRTQLKEMAVFNTNLAHVNNILVNESLALTQEDKIKVINEFKKVDSITESQKKYKDILTEMKGSKKTLTESIENKVSASISASSKQKLDEVSEKTAYQNDAHINKMKKLIEYVENTRGKKIIN